MTTQTITKCNISHCTREVSGIAYNGNPYCNVCMPSEPKVRYQTEEGCERCTYDIYVPHFRCVYYGERVGHSKAHCTASGCY